MQKHVATFTKKIRKKIVKKGGGYKNIHVVNQGGSSKCLRLSMRGGGGSKKSKKPSTWFVHAPLPSTYVVLWSGQLAHRLLICMEQVRLKVIQQQYVFSSSQLVFLRYIPRYRYILYTLVEKYIYFSNLTKNSQLTCLRYYIRQHGPIPYSV